MFSDLLTCSCHFILVRVQMLMSAQQETGHQGSVETMLSAQTHQAPFPASAHQDSLATPTSSVWVSYFLARYSGFCLHNHLVFLLPATIPSHPSPFLPFTLNHPSLHLTYNHLFSPSAPIYLPPYTNHYSSLAPTTMLSLSPIIIYHSLGPVSSIIMTPSQLQNNPSLSHSP